MSDKDLSHLADAAELDRIATLKGGGGQVHNWTVTKLLDLIDELAAALQGVRQPDTSACWCICLHAYGDHEDECTKVRALLRHIGKLK